MDQIRFQEAVSQVMDKVKEESGIGTLSEKTIHAVLKYYYSPNICLHEQKVSGYIADIFTGSQIIEIQTRNFNTLRRKLDVFLPDYEVTIVYPIAHTKWLRWINPENGEISPKRKSPKTGAPYEIFHELYRIKSYLPHPNLHICIAMLDIEEYRILDGWSTDKKKGSHRNDAFPVAFAEEILIESVKDYLRFLPIELPDEFTVTDYQKTAKMPKKTAGTALHIFNYTGIIEQIGKRSRSYLYRVK